jgi:hypothetical protein
MFNVFLALILEKIIVWIYMLSVRSNIKCLIVAVCLISLIIINSSGFGYNNSLTFDINVVSENSIVFEELIHLSS